MSTPAQVRNVEAIEHFRAQLAKYEEQVQVSLESLTSELQRATNWLRNDRPSYWKKQTKQAEDGVHEAKMELERCIMFPTVSGERPACREERTALRKAQARLEYCREKVERVRYWNRQIQHEMLEYTGRIGQLKRLLENELPAARAKLQQIVRRLDEYQIERTPLAQQAPITSKTEETSDEDASS